MRVYKFYSDERYRAAADSFLHLISLVYILKYIEKWKTLFKSLFCAHIQTYYICNTFCSFCLLIIICERTRFCAQRYMWEGASGHPRSFDLYSHRRVALICAWAMWPNWFARNYYFQKKTKKYYYRIKC